MKLPVTITTPSASITQRYNPHYLDDTIAEIEAHQAARRARGKGVSLAAQQRLARLKELRDMPPTQYSPPPRPERRGVSVAALMAIAAMGPTPSRRR